MSQSTSEKSDPPRRILVGVAAGIAAYKAPDLVRRLRERGAEVRVAMTSGAHQFIAPLTLQAVSGHRVHTTLLDEDAEAGMGHIELARWADDIVIAPATADLCARLAHGMADDIVTTTVLASSARLWLAPAMNAGMWDHPATRANIEMLRGRGVELLGPDHGDQACGDIGPGRMLEPAAIAARLLGGALQLGGKRFVVTAGPTFEALDPVRYIGNRSSGRMGFALAEALKRAGAEVTLVAGPVHLPTPAGVHRVDVRTARAMREAVFEHLPADGFVSVAAVADFRPETVAENKIKRGGEGLELRLLPNPDIVREVAASSPRPFTVGFAAETTRVQEHARAKLSAKGLDLIAANRVGDDCGFDRGDNALVVYSADAEWDLGSASKQALAERLVDLIAGRMHERETE